jgi:hypothetical protein
MTIRNAHPTGQRSRYTFSNNFIGGERMTATDAQVRLIMKERAKGHTQEQAAVKANLRSRKTVRKYEQLGYHLNNSGEVRQRKMTIPD